MNKRRLQLVLLSALISVSCNLIAQSPGGIEGQSFWLKHRSSNGVATSDFLNFNPAIAIDKGDMNIELPSSLNSLRRVTIFTVYFGINTPSELPIWQLTGDLGDISLSTDHVASTNGRLKFDFKNGSAQTQPGKSQPYIHTYSAFNIIRESSAKVISYGAIQLGSNEFNQKGISDSRLIPEIILYDRILEEEEFDKIETYLALKYGVTLEKNYVSSTGKIIWNHNVDSNYSHNIAGIGRNDQSAIYQKQSASSNFPRELVIGVQKIGSSNETNYGKLDNDEYLVWGDNGKRFTLTNRDENFQLLEKSWLMTITGKGVRSNFTQLKIDVNNLLTELRKGDMFYLVIDRTGHGDFSSTQRSYIKADSISADGIATFNNVAWDTDGSGKDVFTIGLKSTSSVASLPNNKNQDDARIQFQLYPNPVSNGQYKLSVKLDKPGDIIVQIYDLSQRIIESWKGSGNSTYFFSGTITAPAGTYTVRLTTGHTEISRVLVIL